MDFPLSPVALTFSAEEEKLKHRLEKILTTQDLTPPRQFVARMCQQLGVDAVDCAAALVVLTQANLICDARSSLTPQVITPTIVSYPKAKMVCYRLEVGAKHNVTVDEIKQVFVTEAGVDIKMIGEVTIRFYYSLIELPEGMPSDIYQLLATVSIQQQKLNLKRLKNRDHSRTTTHLRRKKFKSD